MISGRRRWALLAAAVFCCVGAAPQQQKVIARIDLSKPFNLPPGASFTATQGPDVTDPAYGAPDTAPGRIRLCVRMAHAKDCAPDLDSSLSWENDPDWSEIHYLQIARIVQPRGSTSPPLLYLEIGSFHSLNGNQLRAAVFLAYRPARHRFDVIFNEKFGLNNNEEVRFIEAGPLKGNVVTAEPTSNAPFGYWMSVSRLTPDYRYRQVLKYRSATRYNDGNPLAVIDSEMPNILQRLGYWRPGQPLPLPAGKCARPRLVKRAQWC